MNPPLYALMPALFLLLLPPGAAAAPKLVCDNNHADLGAARVGTKVKHSFQLRNAGDEDLVITQVKPNCGCTTTTLPKTTLAPGETVALESTLDLTNRPGLQIKTIEVFSNDGGMAGSVFRLEKRVVGETPIRVTPPVHSLGMIPSGATLEKRTRIERSDGGDLVLGEVRGIQGASSNRVERLEGGKACEIVTTLNTAGKSGSFFESVLVNLNFKEQPYVTVQFVGTVQEAFAVAPRVLVFPAKGEGTYSQVVTVRKSTVKEFRILSAEWPDASAQVAVMPPMAIGQQVRISGIRPDPAWNGKELLLRTDHAAHPVIRIPIQVTPP